MSYANMLKEVKRDIEEIKMSNANMLKEVKRDIEEIKKQALYNAKRQLFQQFGMEYPLIQLEDNIKSKCEKLLQSLSPITDTNHATLYELSYVIDDIQNTPDYILLQRITTGNFQANNEVIQIQLEKKMDQNRGEIISIPLKSFMERCNKLYKENK